MTSLLLIDKYAMEFGDCLRKGLKMDELPVDGWNLREAQGDPVAVKRKALLGPFRDIVGRDDVQVKCGFCGYLGNPTDMVRASVPPNSFPFA